MATDEIQFKDEDLKKAAPVVAATSLSARAEALGIPYLDEMPHNFDKEVLKYISQDSSKKYGVVPYKMNDGVLYVAVLDPENFEALNVLRFLSEKEKIGIRIENNYWVTKTGCIDLFKEIPITTEAIEKAMKK